MKLSNVLFISISALLVFLQCDNTGLYELAMYDPAMAIAITDDGVSTNSVLVTDGKYSTREYISGGPYFTPTKLYVNRKGYLLASSGGGFYLSRNGYSTWEGPIAFPPTGSFFYAGPMEDTFYAVTSSAGTYYMYRLDMDSLSWADETNLTSSTVGTSRLVHCYNGEILMVSETGADTYSVYTIVNMVPSEIAALNDVSSVITLPLIFAARQDQDVFLGTNTALLASDQSALQALHQGFSSAIDFCINNDTYHSCLTGSELSVYNGTNFTAIYTFSAASGAFLEPMTGSMVAVGSNGNPGGADNGLLLFDLSTQSLLQQITSKNVKGLCVFRRDE